MFEYPNECVLGIWSIAWEVIKSQPVKRISAEGNVTYSVEEKGNHVLD